MAKLRSTVERFAAIQGHTSRPVAPKPTPRRSSQCKQRRRSRLPCSARPTANGSAARDRKLSVLHKMMSSASSCHKRASSARPTRPGPLPASAAKTPASSERNWKHAVVQRMVRKSRRLISDEERAARRQKRRERRSRRRHRRSNSSSSTESSENEDLFSSDADEEDDGASSADDYYKSTASAPAQSKRMLELFAEERQCLVPGGEPAPQPNPKDILSYLEDSKSADLVEIMEQQAELSASEEVDKDIASIVNGDDFDVDTDVTDTESGEEDDYFNDAPLMYFRSPSRALRKYSPVSSIFAAADPRLLSKSAPASPAAKLKDSRALRAAQSEVLLQARIELATLTLDRALKTKCGRRILRREARRKFHRSKSRARQSMLTYVKIAVTKAFSPHQAGREYDRRYKRPKYNVRRSRS